MPPFHLLFWVFACCLLVTERPSAQSAEELAESAYEILEHTDNYAEAGHLLYRAAQLTTEPFQRAQRLMDAGDALRYDEKPDSAILAYQQLAAQKAGRPEIDSLRALALHLTGWLHTTNDDYAASLEPYRRAIEIRNERYPRSHNDRAKTHFNLALALYELGRFDEAERYFQESDRLYGALAEPDSMRWIRVFNGLAQNYRAQEDPQLTKAAVLRVLPMILAYYRNDPDRLAHYFYEHSANLSSIGLPELFEEKMEAAIALYEAAGDVSGEAMARLARATVPMEQNDHATAIPRLREVQQLLQRSGDEDGFLAYVYFNLAESYLKTKQPARALDNAEAAISAYSAWQDTANLIGSYHLRASIHSALGNTAAATQDFSTSIAMMDIEQPIQPNKVPAAKLVAISELLDDRAQHYQRQGALDKAEADYEHIFKLQDRIRLELKSEESQVYVGQRIRPVYQRAIGLQFARYLQNQDRRFAERALVLAERSKAFSLLLAARAGNQDRPRRERELRRRIARLERSTTSETSTELAEARLELERLQNQRPVETALPPAIDLAALLDYLSARSMTLVEFVVGEATAYRLDFYPDGKLNFIELTEEANLATQVSDFRDAIRRSAYKTLSLKEDQQQLDQDFKVAAQTLYGSVLKDFFVPPVPAGARPKELKNRLLIVPDGVLGFLPFSALFLDSEQTVPLNYAELPYLGRDREIGYSYSAAYLLELAGQPRVLPGKNLLAFAPTFRGNNAGKDFARSRAVEVANGGLRAFPALAPLAYNEEEVVAATDFFSRTKALLGPEAKRNNFEALAADYRMLLISSHAFVNSRDPNLSFIAFSQAGDSLETEEMLFLNDLATFELPTELAVLSACETSMGKVAPGEGVLSLARAFARAGAASTLTTLWKVDDEATKQLSIDFFAALAAGKSRSAALLEAQQKALTSEVFAHPYYWSAMTLYGKGDELELSPSKSSWLPGILLGLIAVFLGYTTWRRKSRTEAK